MENVKKSERMEKIAQEVIAEFSGDLSWIEEEEIKIAYVCSDKNRRHQGHRVFGECRKTDQTVKALTQCDFIITFYEPNIKRFTDEQLHILMYHELLHAGMKNGNTAVEPHDYIVGEFRKVINRYGADWAEDLTEKQKERMDGNKE